jgi:ribosome-associated protein
MAESKKTAGKAAAPRKTPRPARAKDEDSPRRIALTAAESGLDKKAVDVEIIDVRGKVDYCDYVVVMSALSERQVNAIAGAVEKDLREKLGVRCYGIEGVPQGRWALLDFGDVIVHAFHHDARGYYDLAALWMDAARVPVVDAAVEKAKGR